MAYSLFNCWVIFHCTNAPLCVIHLPVEGHLGCFQVWATVRKLLWPFQCSFWMDIIFCSFLWIWRSVIAFIRNRRLSPAGFVPLHPHQQEWGFYDSTASQHLESSVFSVFAVVFRCCSVLLLMASGVDHFCIRSHLYVLFDRFLFRSFALFVIGLFVFLVLSFKSLLWILSIIR